MTKRSRTMLFFICALFVLLASPLMVLYSQGYRFDLNPEPGEKVITKTGGLYLKTEPKQAEIYLDGKLEEKTDFLFSSALIKNLLPKNYDIVVKKDGLSPWEKNLKINAKEVTEVKSVILFPENIEFSLLTTSTSSLPAGRQDPWISFFEKSTTTAATSTSAETFSGYTFKKIKQSLLLLNNETNNFEKFFDDVKDYKISPDGKKLVYFSDYEIWIFFVQDIWEQPQKKAGQNLFLTRDSEKIGDVFWLNNDYLVFNTGDKIKISEIDDRDKINAYDIAEFKNPQIFWNTADRKLYILNEKKYYASEILPK